MILGVSAFVRFYNLGENSVWVDETNPAFAAKGLIETGVDLLPSGIGYGRAMIYTHVTAWSERFFGFNETGIRVPAAVFGILSILAGYFLTLRIFDRKTALVAAAMIGLSGFEIGWSRVARMYTCLQFLSLCIILLFFWGFENRNRPTIASGRGLLKWHRMLLSQGIHSVWLVAGVVLLGITATGVHMLSAFLLLGIWIYLLFRSADSYIFEDDRSKWLNKYSISSLLILIGGILVFFALPSVKAMLDEFLSYTPSWVQAGTSASDRMALLEFLISPWRFPISAFFLTGFFFLFIEEKKEGWLLPLIFGAIFALLSFVFTHREPRYLMPVYPLFLIIAAFGLVRFFEVIFSQITTEKLPRSGVTKAFVILSIAALFILTPWLRVGLNIPWKADGSTNMAVTSEEWKEAAAILKDRAQAGEVIISSLPQTLLFYKIPSDFVLNQNNLDLSISKNIKNKQGNWMDVYTAFPFIESDSMLTDLISKTPSGWIVVSDFHLTHDVYVPGEIAAILNHGNFDVLKTKKGTVSIYHWKHE